MSGIPFSIFNSLSDLIQVLNNFICIAKVFLDQEKVKCEKVKRLETENLGKIDKVLWSTLHLLLGITLFNIHE